MKGRMPELNEPGNVFSSYLASSDIENILEYLRISSIST